MTGAQGILPLTLFFEFLCSSIVTRSVQAPIESRETKVLVEAAPFLLTSAIGREGRSALARDQTEEDVTSGREQAVEMIPLLLSCAVIRGRPALAKEDRAVSKGHMISWRSLLMLSRSWSGR
jgi:hypothetical protein